jgi:hypothetical protein
MIAASTIGDNRVARNKSKNVSFAALDSDCTIHLRSLSPGKTAPMWRWLRATADKFP